MSKFTAGPWQVHGSHVYGPDPERELVAQAHGNGDGSWTAVGGSRMVSNRNLIAAAPELYEALIDLVGCTTDKTLKAARAALAKADGAQ